MFFAKPGSDHLVDGPDEGSDADLLVALVEFADSEEKVVDLVVGEDGEDGVVELGPSVGAAVGVADLVAAALDVLPEGEAPDAEGVEHELDAFVVGLIVYYQYGFHIISFLGSSGSSRSSRQMFLSELLS